MSGGAEGVKGISVRQQKNNNRVENKEMFPSFRIIGKRSDVADCSSSPAPQLIQGLKNHRR